MMESGSTTMKIFGITSMLNTTTKLLDHRRINTMPKYKVIAVMEVGYASHIEAKDDEDAWNKAKD